MIEKLPEEDVIANITRRMSVEGADYLEKERKRLKELKEKGVEIPVEIIEAVGDLEPENSMEK